MVYYSFLLDTCNVALRGWHMLADKVKMRGEEYQICYSLLGQPAIVRN